MYYFSMILVIVASALYHISQSAINDDLNPIISIIITYIVALILSFLSLLFIEDKSIIKSFKDVRWPSYVLGVSIFIIEIGYLLVYRSGWNINIAALFSNVITTIMLVFVGLYIFKEQLSVINVFGIILSVVGLILMKK